MDNNVIKPGKTWLDTTGNRIQAHAGGLFYENDTFYWYGENKEKTDGQTDIWTWGVKYYSSKDLYNWKDEGYLIPPELTDENSHLHPKNWLDRPHILYNEATKKYVCWLKFSGEIGCFAVMTADHFKGPYTMVKDNVRPYGNEVGDFDIAKDEETGKAYIYFEYDHNGIAAFQLSSDYLETKGEPQLYYVGLKPPFTREGVTLFEHNNLKYLLTSGMSGYVPNPSEAAHFEEWLGAITVQGNPHLNDKSGASFNSQISQVFKHPKKEELYIVMADRWVPGCLMTEEKTDIFTRVIASQFDPSYKVTQEEMMQLAGAPLLGSANTSIADYVWLPLRFDGEKAVIEWKDEWRIEDYN